MTQATEQRHGALIVEDDRGLSALCASMLEEFDLAVDQVATAEEALDFLKARGGEIAVLLADIRLPGEMDGMRLAHSVSLLWPEISLIVTSGDVGDRLGELPERAIFIPKPWRALDIVSIAQRAASDDHTLRAVRL